ncbi:MAG: dioxygenase [Verrucomicrobiota bacterium]
MSAIVSGAHKRLESSNPSFNDDSLAASGPASMVKTGARSGSAEGADFSYVDLGDSARVALMINPRVRGSCAKQLGEILSRLAHVLEQQPQPMTITSQTVFLREAGDEAECARVLAEFYGTNYPVTSFVLEPPCDGAALALEAWAIGGKSVRVDRHSPQVLTVSYDSVRWVYCAGIKPRAEARGAYSQTLDALEQLRAGLALAGSSFEQVVRTWFYLGGITEMEGDCQRYLELNRARTDFYHDVRFRCSMMNPGAPKSVYPASTGIGMTGGGLVLGCLALETRRDDVFLLPLENPQQIPAYAYHPKYSPQSPKFSRAVALGLGDYITTWISGTASIVNSETCHVGDIGRQTEQTLDNIERLISPDNFARHGVSGAGAHLHDLAKYRVYLKRAEDLAQCQAVCQRKLGPVPVIYTVADVCRSDLLVEIEAVAFTRCSRPPTP